MYTFTSRIRYSETDSGRKLKPETVIDYFQDCSSFQSEDLGVGFEFMEQRHVAWIVNYWQIDFLRRPSFGERVRIGTSPYGFKGFIGLRNFLMETADAAEHRGMGEKLAIANSVWSLFDLEKGIPVRVLPEMIDAYELFPKFDMEYLPRKVRVPAEPDQSGSTVIRNDIVSGGRAAGSAAGDTADGDDRNRSGTAGSSLVIPVTEDMLDSNHHMNNGQYVRIALSLLPENSGEIRRLRVEYLAQAHLGDIIVPQIICSEKVTTIALRAEHSGKPYAAVEIAV